MRIAFLFFLCTTLAFGQVAQEDYRYIERNEHIAIGLSKGKFNIVKTISEKAEFLTSNNLYYANEAIHFDGFSEIQDIEAFTYIPASDKTVKVDYIETKHEFDNGIFYSDQQSKNFTFPAVTKGAITNLSYKEVSSDPHFLGLFRFGSYAPTQKAMLRITFPKNVEIGYKTFHTQDQKIQFTKDETPEGNTYTWIAENVGKYFKEEDGEDVLHYLPHMILHIKSYTENGKTIPVLNSTDDLYAWYTSLVKEVDTNNLKDVYKIAEKVAAPHNTKAEKAKALYNWVQENITYVAFEDGLGGFIPRGAASVCSKRYGDCKDMANLLYVMLNHVGIEAYRTWIGTRNRPYSYYEVPTPMADNHMITAAIIENDTIFIDGTDSYVSYGLPSSFTQTKEALIGISENKYIVKKVPEVAFDRNTTKVTTHMTLDGATLHAKEKRVLKGYEKVQFVSDYKYKKEDRGEEEYLNTKLALGNNKTKYTNITIGTLESKAETLEIAYDLEINNYTKSIAGKTFLNLNIDRALVKQKIDIDSKKFAKKIEHKYLREYTTSFEIPEGYNATSIPDTITYEQPDFGFSISYTQEGNTIIQNKSIYINTLRIEKDAFETWNAFIKKLIKAYKKSIIIEKQ